MIEITCDSAHMDILLQFFDNTDGCLISWLSHTYSCCCYDYDCARCLSENIKWNIID